MDYIGWNNDLERDFLAFSKYFSMKPERQNLDYLEHHKLGISDPGKNAFLRS
jgi:hypothetical protein